MAGGSRGTDSQDLATILDPLRAIFDDLGPDRHADLNIVILIIEMSEMPRLRCVRLEHCDIAKMETSETSTLAQWRHLRLQHCVLRQQRCVF